MGEEENDKQIAAAFNAGYLMDKYEPELLKKVLKSNDGKNEYMQVMEEGKKQNELEKVIAQQQRIKEKQQTKKRTR
jgi:hypothetical protein